MDRKKTKKIQNARIIMTNIFMGLSVIAIVFILMLIAMGFSFNENGNLEQSGLLQLSSHPSGATVEIDGETQFSRTEISKMLSSGEHKVKITKSGYDTWETNVRVDAGLLTNISWVRLFPLNPVTEKMATYDQARLISFSSDRKSLLYSEQNSTKLLFINLQGDSIKANKINLSDILDITDTETLRTAAISVAAWNTAGSKVLINWTHNNTTDWILADLEKPENSTNLTQKFNLVFSKILIANDSASKLWALENGNLRIIDLSNITISTVKASGVENFTNNNDVVAYLRTGAKNNKDGNQSTVRVLELFREGEKGASTIADLTAENPSTFTVALGAYWGEEWLSYSVNNKVTILSGKFPSYDKPSKNALKVSLKREIDYSPSHISSSNEERIVAYTAAGHIMAFDFETKDYYDISLDSESSPHWLDDYIFWQHEEDKVAIHDFNGQNYRDLITDTNNELPICLTANNKWLYYFDIKEQEQEQTTEEGTEETAVSSETETQKIQYILKREKLNI